MSRHGDEGAGGRAKGFGRPALGLAILILPGAVGACTAAGPPATASAALAGSLCPAPDWAIKADGVRLPTERVWNRLSVDRDGSIYWNDRPIDAATLTQIVDLIPTSNPVPETDLEVDPDAPCEAVARVMELIGRLDCARYCHYAVKPRPVEGRPGPN